jgi:hypothetical protein
MLEKLKVCAQKGLFPTFWDHVNRTFSKKNAQLKFVRKDVEIIETYMVNAFFKLVDLNCDGAVKKMQKFGDEVFDKIFNPPKPPRAPAGKKIDNKKVVITRRRVPPRRRKEIGAGDAY